MSRRDKYVREANKMFEDNLTSGLTKKESFKEAVKDILTKVFKDKDQHADKSELCKCGHLYLFHKPKCCGDPVKCRCEKFESLAKSEGGKDG